jgi:hypothetical protein
LNKGIEVMAKSILRFTSVRFYKFKGFKQFTLHLREFNILVGPNNCGKSTILGAFRILAEGIRKANAKSPFLVDGPNGTTLGYPVDLSEIPVATENVFFNYDDTEPAIVTFKLSNKNEMLLFFKEVGTCMSTPIFLDRVSGFDWTVIPILSGQWFSSFLPAVVAD